MKFVLTETIKSDQSDAILESLEQQFKMVSESTTRNGNVIVATSIQASFGSINRSDDTNVSIKNTKNGLLIVAEVDYRPSFAFWIFFVLTLFSWVLWIVPVFFYLNQKSTVKECIKDVFKTVKDEHEQADFLLKKNDNILDIQRYAELRDKGHITEDEFQKKKKELLGA